MFDKLKNFLGDFVSETPRERPFEAQDYQLAAAALLVHIASIDGVFDAQERAHLQNIVEQRFGLGHAEARDLIQHATESEREAVDLYHFTSVLKRTLDEDGRRQLVAMLWEMAFADGEVHEFEENVVWRVSELLGISTRERVMLKREAKDEAEGQTQKGEAPGPWGKS
jgi:uncharacterized tellurite resistance protein B-like protein